LIIEMCGGVLEVCGEVGGVEGGIGSGFGCFVGEFGAGGGSHSIAASPEDVCSVRKRNWELSCLSNDRVASSIK